VRFQTEKVRSALIKVTETMEHSLTYCEANSLIEEISSYRFLITIIVWYDILFHINLVSKMMQNKTLSIDSASKLADSKRKFLLSYRENGFKDALCKATEPVEEMCVPSEFSEIRVGRKCQLSSYKPEDEAQPQGEKIFRT
jgi:hypothetical protein